MAFDGVWWVPMGSDGVLMGFDGFRWSFDGVWWVLMGFDGFWWVLMGSDGFWWAFEPTLHSNVHAVYTFLVLQPFNKTNQNEKSFFENFKFFRVFKIGSGGNWYPTGISGLDSMWHLLLLKLNDVRRNIEWEIQILIYCMSALIAPVVAISVSGQIFYALTVVTDEGLLQQTDRRKKYRSIKKSIKERSPHQSVCAFRSNEKSCQHFAAAFPQCSQYIRCKLQQQLFSCCQLCNLSSVYKSFHKSQHCTRMQNQDTTTRSHMPFWPPSIT